MRVQIKTLHPSRRISLRKIKKLAEVVLGELGQKDKELSILLVDNNTIRELNSSYRGVNEPTDVLAFSQTEGGFVPQEEVLGDVVLSLDKAQEAADRFHCAIDKEILLYLIHGVFHLLGFGDNNKEMHKKERRLLEKIWKKRV